MTPRAGTRLLGVVGWPVAHSLSPEMQNAGFAELGLDWLYVGFPVEPGQLEQAIAGARALGVLGLNVTLPHKVEAMRHARPDALARRVGATNTLSFVDTEGRPLPDGAPPEATNTDVHGFRTLLEEEGTDVRGRRAIVLGAGGAARAVVVALADAGADVTVVSRTPRPLGVEPEPAHAPWTAESLPRLLPEAALLVDTTPRGLPNSPPDTSPPPPLERLPKGALVVDIAVRVVTPLVAAARAHGLRAATGEAMLLHQGAASFTRWTGRPAPVGAMRAALTLALAGR